MTRRTPAQYDWDKVEFDETILGKHRTSPRREKIQFVVVHHMAMVGEGDGAANDACVRTWQTREASAQYCVDGKFVRQVVWDGDAAWATGDSHGNHAGISIEHANSTGSPSWKVSDTTVATGAKLVAYLHKAYGLGRPVAGKTLRRHKDFSSTACPGPYLGDQPNADELKRIERGDADDDEYGIFHLYVAEAQRVYDEITEEPTVPDPKPAATSPIQSKLWKITLPIGKPGKPTEHYPANKGQHPFYYRDGEWLIFNAPVDGVTTSGSGYPRSELREMTAKAAKAAWSSRKGWHNLSGTAEIRKVPGRKPSVVIAQIHDDEDDVVMIRLDGSVLYVYESLGKGKGAKKHKILSGYLLGDALTYSISAAAGGIRVVVNGNTVDIPGRLIDGGYFKAGCYSQANESNGTGAAEVAHKNVKVRHI